MYIDRQRDTDIYIYIHTHNGIFIIKKEIVLFAATLMELQIINYTNQSKSDREKPILYYVIYMWHLKNK